MAMNQKEFEDMFAPEDLHEDLIEHISEMTNGMKKLTHPYVYEVPYIEISNKRLNQFYAYKCDAIKTAMREHNWSQTIWLHERPYRLEAFSNIAIYLDDDEYWSLLGEIWTDSENIWQNLAYWKTFLQSKRPKRQYLMNAGERKRLKKLPETLVVYRGTNAPDAMGSGISWTLDEEKAKWFSKRYFAEGKECKLLSGTVAKKDCIAYFEGLNESEIVSIAVKHIRVVTK